MRDALAALNVEELIEVARENGISGALSKKRAQLVDDIVARAEDPRARERIMAVVTRFAKKIKHHLHGGLFEKRAKPSEDEPKGPRYKDGGASRRRKAS